MKVAVLALFLAGGCSWVTARAHNDPRVGCSRTPGRADAVLALAGAAVLAGAVVVRISDPPGPDGDHGNGGLVIGLWALTGTVVALTSAVQASYGLGVADRCRAARAKLASPPMIVPGPPGATPSPVF
jgi:hypothetical protein